MERLLVVGGVSIDTLHLSSGKKIAPGGAGLYTALAAQNTGVSVTLFAPRPNPIPADFDSITKKIDWLGPDISLGQLPRLEIAHYGGGKAKLLGASWGAQSDLSPSMLPKNLVEYSRAHLSVMPSPTQQLEFLQYFLNQKKMMISSGTNGYNAYSFRDIVMEIFNRSNTFFMNENECVGLFGSIDNIPRLVEKTLFVTMGAKGVTVFENDKTFRIAAPSIEEIDPTGAGDTFCGTTLGELMKGKSTEEAALQGVLEASKMIQGIGPALMIEWANNDHNGNLSEE